MTATEERRTQGTQRVSLQALVEICGNEPGIPAFEAQAVNVSGRGMHVRTAYLPELGVPLVCRFEEGGREILVEGRVAWRNESTRGGEFGIQFTALDTASLAALSELCGPPIDAEVESESAGSDDARDEGSRVRLHIDGLGSPMKARVRTVGQRQVHVGSNLEFLKVGRHLEIEDVDQGRKRGARIDAVNIALDAQTQIPQLVVVLRYDDGQETTPEPSVIDAHVPSEEGPPVERVTQAAMPARPVMDEHDAPSPPDDAAPAELELTPEEASALRGGLAELATRAGATIQHTGSNLARFGLQAAGGVRKLWGEASTRAQELRSRSGTTDRPPPRVTKDPPPQTSERARLRPQNAPGRAASAPAVVAAPSKQRVKRVASAGAAAALAVTVGIIALQSPEPAPGAQASGSSAAAAPASPRTLSDSTESQASGSGAPADVPLFGPTPMATMEPAPLGPAPEAAREETTKADAPEAAPARSPSAVADESFDEPRSDGKKAKDSDSKRKVDPSDVEPWGRGKMRTPTVHRLRLNEPGEAIQGSITSTGFSVVIPGRKVMEPAAPIRERDRRMAKVAARNSSSGATVTFQFKDDVPGYRVRLRKDYVEFLISADPKSDSDRGR